LWALTQVLVGAHPADRISIVIPYAILMALSFAASVGVMIWLSGDLARRLARNFALSQRQVSAAGILAAVATGLFGVFGSIQYLYSAGFTNFIMAVAVVAATSYLALTNPVRLGWCVLPLGGLAAVGLWTPLVLALVPAGIYVAYSLIRTKIWVGVTWLVAVGVFGVVTVLEQASAVLGASDTDSASSFNEEIGALGAGMTGFNLSLGIAAPIIAIFMSIVIWKRSGKMFALLLPVPVIVGSVLALVFVVGADSSGVSRLTAYYVLKSLNASYLFFIPLLVAAATLALVVLIARLSVLHSVLVVVSAFVIGASTFGFIGFSADKLASTFTPAPGIRVALEREFWINNPDIGIQIANSARAAQANPEYTPLVWEGVGILQNLWVQSLTNVVSARQVALNSDVSVTPYSAETLAQIAQYIYANPTARLQLMWWSPEVGSELEAWVSQYPAERILAPKVVLD
jgi:hypothetical protein